MHLLRKFESGQAQRILVHIIRSLYGNESAQRAASNPGTQMLRKRRVKATRTKRGFRHAYYIILSVRKNREKRAKNDCVRHVKKCPKIFLYKTRFHKENPPFPPFPPFFWPKMAQNRFFSRKGSKNMHFKKCHLNPSKPNRNRFLAIFRFRAIFFSS